jgi:hypothetical protein
VFWIGIGATGLAALLVLTIIYLRVSLERSSRDEQAFLSVWRPLLLSSLNSSVPAMLPRLDIGHRLYFLKLWNGLMRTASGEAADNLTGIAYAIGCDQFSRRFLRLGNRVECLLATLTLAHLRDHTAWDLLITQTLSADSVTSINAFHALVQIDAESTAQQLTPLLLARNDWAIAQVAAIMQSAQGAFMFPLIEATMETKSVHLIRTLRLIEALHLALPQAAVLRLFEHAASTEALIGALRIADDVSLLPHVRRYLRHDDWRVRVQAAKLLGRIGEHSDVNRLIPLLADVEWWVRYRTAQALAGMPFFSATELELLRNNLSDRFARDMLGQVLAERTAS